MMKAAHFLRPVFLLMLAVSTVSISFAQQDSIPQNKVETFPLVAETPSLFTLLTHDPVKFQIASYMQDSAVLENFSERMRMALLNKRDGIVMDGRGIALKVYFSYVYLGNHRNETHEMKQLLGLAYLLAKNFPKANEAFHASAKLAKPEEGIVDSILIYTANYLKKYYKNDSAAMFPHFNGGFFPFLQDSLKWNPDFPSERLNAAIRVMMDLQMILPSMNVTWMELTGDLLLNHSYRFYGRWYSSIAYYKAGKLAGEKEKGPFWYKSAFAMESNRLNPRYFNDERFDEFEKGILEEQKWDSLALALFGNEKKGSFSDKILPDSLKKIWETSDSLGNAWFAFLPADSTRPLLITMAKDYVLMEERQQPFNPNADLENADMKKKVKRNVFFNVYAIFIILVVVGAVFFFVRQVRKIDREFHGSGKK